jgi:hypothetical protein
MTAASFGTPMPSLPGVTLVCIDCVNHDLAIAALGQCVQKCAFGRVLFITDRPFALDGVDVVTIPSLVSRDAYSHFVVKELGRYIDTPHALLIQWDGFVVNAAAWTDEFLGYDYIGARWGWEQECQSVGNGGFSLRSKRLLDALVDPEIVDIAIEDAAICRTYRPLLESRHGIRFAPGALADRFAFETTYPEGTPFGFHGLFNFWLYFGKADIEAFIAMATPAILGSPQCLQLAKNLAELQRNDEATAMLERIVAAHPAQREPAQLLRSLRNSRGRADPAPAKAPGRNDPCPCGSGRRYKACHGALG